MLEDMATIGIDTLIFQQGLDCRQGWDCPRAYYPSKTWTQPDWLGEDLCGAVVDTADRLGMNICHSFGTMHRVDP